MSIVLAGHADVAAPAARHGWPREAVLMVSDERDEWHRVLLAAERNAFHRGRSDGWRTGRAALLADLAAWERAHYELIRPTLMSPEQAELEARRWGPGGRGHFGDGRPGDYRGGPVRWESAMERAA